MHSFVGNLRFQPYAKIQFKNYSLTLELPIVEKNPHKFKIDKKELSSRRYFIDATRDEVKSMKEKMSLNRTRDRDITARQPLLEASNESKHTKTGLFNT